MSAVPHLQKQLQELTVAPPAGFRVEAPNDIYEWVVWFCCPEESPYAGGQYKALMTFPKDFPMKPPEFRIVSAFWHPNVYPSGQFCISILHSPGEDDLNSEETAMLRWTPVRTIHSILVSIMSLLMYPDPQDAGAPANVEALSQFRKSRGEFNATCAALAAKSLTQLPPNFVAPSLEEVVEKPYAWHPDSYHEADDDEEVYISSQPAQGGNYMEELHQLRSMEFAPHLSDDELLELLAKHKGEVAGVILELS